MDILNAIPKRHPDIAWRAVVDEGLLVNPHNSQIYPLNPIGLRVWQESEGNKSVSSIIEELFEEFDAPKDVLSQDIVEFVEKLQSENLLLIN